MPGPGSGTKHLTEAERQRIRTLIHDGHMSATEVSRVTGYSFSQIRVARQSATPKPRSGRPVMPENEGKPKRVRDRRKESAARHEALVAKARAAPPPVIAWKPAAPVVIDRSKTIVLITGANRGIGLAMVQSLLHTNPNPAPAGESAPEADNETGGASSSRSSSSSSSSSGNASGNDNGDGSGNGNGDASGSGNGDASGSGSGSGNGTSSSKGSVGGDRGPYHVFLCSRDPAKGETAAASLTAEHGNTVSVLQLDVTSDVSIKLAAQRVESEVGRIDVLVNNAGTLRQIGDPVDVLRDALESNLVSAYAMTEAFKMLLMAQQGGGERKGKRLIHVSSDQGSIQRRSDPGDPLYHSQLAEFRISKAALNMMTACQRYATKDAGVKVCAWSPGFTATGLGGSDPELSKLHGAKETSSVGDAFVKIVRGERDGDLDKLLDTFEGTVPW